MLFSKNNTCFVLDKLQLECVAYTLCMFQSAAKYSGW